MGKVSDSESSISESDCEALIASDPESDAEQLETSSRKDKVVQESSSVTQTVINEKILAQLDKLGKRLDSIENNVSKQGVVKNKCKKSKLKPDSSVTVSPCDQVKKIPDLTVLRQDMSVQALVDQHLKQLADAEKTGTKIKSLRGGSVEVLVPNRVKWPLEYVLSGLSKERISYDQLSTTQWVAGFCRIMKEEKNSNIRDNMLDYMISLFDYANDFSWDVAKASHGSSSVEWSRGKTGTIVKLKKLTGYVVPMHKGIMSQHSVTRIPKD